MERMPAWPSQRPLTEVSYCHRPYGTPCVHEHACSRCRFSASRPPRIEGMTCNAEARLIEDPWRVPPSG
ncbi:hypothetical protein E1286_29035 [Nonomuraea terrae]|uniref:Uncharacterized protein n=1 Tax=Nonomuraea terrae TaxID=2530383 RepID=A0A4R4YIV5_9ACTN|nr:hypothetical protein E1286_29035 [Nonomuraea terrae]